jgi:hypothetical protein
MEDILSTVNNELQPNTTITKQIKKKKRDLKRQLELHVLPEFVVLSAEFIIITPAPRIIILTEDGL